MFNQRRYYNIFYPQAGVHNSTFGFKDASFPQPVENPTHSLLFYTI